MRTFLLGCAAAAFLAGGAALAQTATPASSKDHHSRMMKAHTRADVETYVTRMFARFDSDQDGFISNDELTAHREQRAQRMEQRSKRFDASAMFERLDLNHDGQVTEAEAQTARAQRLKERAKAAAKPQTGGFGRRLAHADSNKDGVITRAEFDAMAGRMHERMAHRQAKGGGHGHILAMADTDKDGRISKAEAEQMALRHFDRADLNHDGTMTPDERRQMRQQMRAQRHQG